MRKFLVGALFIVLTACSQDDVTSSITSAEITSPDGRSRFVLSTESGNMRYSVFRDGEQILAPSDLGFSFKVMAPIGKGLKITSVTTNDHDDTWEQPWGERRFVRDYHRELFVSLKEMSENGRMINFRVRAFNDGLGFRYEFPKQASVDSAVIMDEHTQFQFTNMETAWWIPARKFNRYEYIYNETPLSEMKEAHTPITMKSTSGYYVSLHEAALVNYSGMTLQRQEDGSLEADLAPWENGDKVRTDGSFVTPWRTLQISDTAAGLMNSSLILNLNEPNKLGDVSWVEPGKYVGVWWEMHLALSTWGQTNDGKPTNHGATTENTKRYIDLAAKNGFSGVLVEGWNTGWDDTWYDNGDVFSFTEVYDDYDIQALSDYASEKGVRLVGHHETSGSITNYENQMDDSFDLFQKMNIAQVKTGYVANAGEVTFVNENGEKEMVHHDGQYMSNHHVRVLEAAAKRKISINSHEPIKDTGLRRTYPNWISREGARGGEYDAWGDPSNPPSHTAILPFTRMLSGPMDYTPGIFDLLLEESRPNNRIKTTLAKQLALYLVIYSPIQMAADLPENYDRFPSAMKFLRDVPTDWEESIALDGAIGDFVTVARRDRNSADWYLGGLTNEDGRTVKRSLTFLEKGKTYLAEIYRDGDNADWDANPYAFTTETREVTSLDTVSIDMAPGGGFAIRFKAE